MARGVEVDRLECLGCPMVAASRSPTGPLVAMGDVKAYKQLTYTHDGGSPQRPACRIVFEVQGGVPVCASFNTVQLSPTKHRFAQRISQSDQA